MSSLNIPLIDQATEEQKLERLKICRTCEHRRFMKGIIQCKKCGCIMNMKTGLAKAKCPLDKWGPVSNEKVVNPNG